MYDTLRIGKKSLTWFVVGATILWAMSAAFLVLPLTAQAATLTAGDLIRGTEKSVYGGYPVYYYGADGKKYLFPTADTYFTWYSDFSTVKVITQAELGAIPFGGNTTFRPGQKLVKFPGDAKVYAVDKGGVLRGIASEAVAVALYGADWYKPANLGTIPEGFQANYTTGTAVTVAADYNKTTAAAGSADIGTDKGIGATPTVSGALTASLASDNPSGMVLPGNASAVTLLKVNLVAGSAAVNLTGLTVKSMGVGAAADFTNIYVYEGATRLTSGRTLASQTREATFSFTYSVPASTTKSLSIVADVASIATAVATAGDTHAFSLTALATTAAVSGLPITGNTMSIGSQSVSTVTVTRGSDPAGPTIGQTDVAVAEFKLTAGTNDVSFQRVTVTVGGTVSVSDLTNFTLYQGSTKLATGTVSSDRVTFALDTAYTITQGSTRIFTIKTDVAGRSGRTIAVYIDSTYPSDLLVADKVYGTGAGYTWTSFAAVATAAATPATGGSFVTTQGGKVTVAFNGPAASDVSKGTSDVVLYKFSMTAGDQAVEVKKMGVTIAGTAGGFVHGSLTTHYFTDIKIKNLDTGAVVMGPKEHTAAASATTTGATPCANSTALCYTDSWTLNAGQKVNLAITADLANAEDAGADEFYDEGYAVTLEGASTTSMREISTGQYLAVADVVGMGTAVAGNTMTVRSSGLTVAIASTPVAGSTVKGTQGVPVIGFALTAGASSAVKVTQLVLAGEGSDDNTFNGTETGYLDDLVITASLWDGTTQVGATKSPSTSGTITFDNLSWNLNAGEVKKLIVKVDVATTLLGTTPDYVFLGLPVANVTSQDSDSNSITATAGTPTPTNALGVTNMLTINSTGTLTVALDGDTPLLALAVSGSANVAMTKVKFTAARESYLVNKLRVVNTSATTGTADSSSADDMIAAVKLSYKKQDGTVGTASGVLSNGVANFSGLGFYVGVDKTEVLTISADLADLNAATGRAAVETPRFGLDFGATGDTNFEAVGVGSSTTLTLGSEITAGTGYVDDTGSQDSEVTGYAVYAVKTKPTVTLAAASPSGASVPGLNEVLRFNVAADASGDLVLDVVTFKITTTDNGNSDWNLNGDGSGVIDLTSSYSLYNASDLTTALEGGDSDWTLYASTDDGTLSGTEEVGYARLVLTTPQTIGAGTSKTFVLKVDTTGASSSTDDTVRFDVLAEAGSANTTLAALTEFQWDESGSNAVADITGTQVKNLTVNGGTIVY